jgi:hypothetical protein
MPCFCDIDRETLDRGRKIIRAHIEAIVHTLKELHEAGDIRDHTSLLEQTHKLLDHLYTGKCDEFH